MTSLVRVCRRLVDGASSHNLKRMCAALGERSDGPKPRLQARVEAKLRALDFAADESFKPTAADIALPLDDFNDKYQNKPVYSIATLERKLRVLSGTPAPAKAPKRPAAAHSAVAAPKAAAVPQGTAGPVAIGADAKKASAKDLGPAPGEENDADE